MLSPIRLSVTRVDQSKTIEVRIMQLSPQSSPMTLVNYFSMMSRLHWYCLAFLSEGWFSELCPMYQGGRVLTFMLAKHSCFYLEKWLTDSFISFFFQHGWLFIMQSATYPSLMSIWQNWAPPGERTRLLAVTFSGQSHINLFKYFVNCFLFILFFSRT